MNHVTVPDRDLLTDQTGSSLVSMDDGVVLDVRPGADLDSIELGPEHSPE